MKYCSICKSKYDDGVSFCPVDGEVLEDDPSSLVDTVLDGQYQMEALLGKGGMGAVYRARHILLGDRVAIKVLPPEVRTNAEWLRRFRREGQAARRFRHPNAVTVYDLRTAADGTIYMVMEYVEGHTLDAELKKRGRLNAREAFDLLTPIMSVLDTAHAMGVVHRDLKPENIMVGNPGVDGAPVIKLLDLGIAKMREIAGVDTGGNTALTMAGQVLGTPYYMSPEQWGEIPRDESQEIDGRADIYSLGLVFYELVAGRRCYSGATLHELRREHVSTPPRPLIDVVPDVPRAFSDALLRATAKDRGDRQSTAGQLAAELRASLGPESKASPTNQVTPANLGETVGLDGTLDTNSDLNAPTLIEMSPSPSGAFAGSSGSGTSPNASSATGSQRAAQPQVEAPAASLPTLASVVTVPQMPRAEAQPKKSNVGIIIGAVVFIVLILGVGIIGVIVYKARQTSTPAVTTSAGTTTPNTTPAVREVAKYWLELEPKKGSDQATRVAGLVPIASGQSLKMHFVFSESGYLYLIGPGPQGNQPTAFLTAKPSPDTGLTTNQASSGADISFPSGESNWLTLDRNPGAENYTVIFSKSPLTSTAALNVPVTGEPLSPANRTELEQFIAKYKGSGPTSELDQANESAPFVRVKATPPSADTPLIFDIRIQHN